MRHMVIKLESVLESEFESLFSVVKMGLYSHVESVFGWCDDYQKNRLINDYEPSWFYWVYSEQTRVGMLCFKQYSNSYHVHLLVVFPEFQNQRLGQAIMAYVHEKAKNEHRDSITLSSFVRNIKAVSFYERLGYKVIDSDENFLSLSLNLAS
ncbi:GNAT family N-acetyltransferase [Vibrio vulnificus]